MQETLLPLILSLASVMASSSTGGQPVSPPPTLEEALSLAKINLTNGIIGGICIAVGLLLCFCGKRFFKLYLGLAGFIVGAVVAVNGLARFGGYLPAENTTTISWVIVIVLGLIAAGLSMWLWKIGVYASAGLGGYALMSFILSLKAGGVIENAMGRTGALVLGAGAAVIAAMFLEDIIIVIASSIIGSLTAIIGLDRFVQTGFTYQLFDTMMIMAVNIDQFHGPMYFMFAGTVALAVLGVVVQLLAPSKGFGRGD
jgi:hypothetical protein